MAEGEVHERGPLFSGEIERVIGAYLEASEKNIAQTGERMVRERLARVLQHPTGYYESHIQIDRQMKDYAVNDGGIVYGPWLEGIGSRNSPVTRFAGYGTFAWVSNRLDGISREIAERTLPPYLRRMN